MNKLLVTEATTSGWYEHPNGGECSVIWLTGVNGPLDQRLLGRGEDLESWFDSDGFAWTEEAKNQVRVELAPERPERRKIQNNARYLDEVRDEALAALVEQNAPPTLFSHGGYPSSVFRDENGVTALRPVTAVRMRERLSDAAEWVNVSLTGAEKPTLPNGSYGSVLVESEKTVQALSPITSVVEVPVLRPDGEFTLRRGYDWLAKVYFSPSVRLGNIAVPDSIGAAEVNQALAMVNEMIFQFPFVERADKVNALGLMLTPIVRHVVEGPVPMAVIDAPTAGTGKTLLANSIVRVLTGHVGSFSRLGSDDDEAEKRITALLLQGPQFVIFDNVSQTVTSEPLKMAITAREWSGRIITTSKMPTVPVRTSWLMTGNNLAFDREMVRRVYVIRLDSGEELPEDRSGFKHNLDVWVPEHRADLLSSLFVIVKAWVQNGRPAWSGRPMGSFEHWSQTVGGVLENVGVDGFLDNEKRKRDDNVDDESEHWAAFYEALRESFGSDWFTARDVAQRQGLWPVTPVDKPDDPRAVGYALRSKRDSRFGGLRLRHRRTTHGARYCVVQ